MLHHERSGRRRDSMRGVEYIAQLDEAPQERSTIRSTCVAPKRSLSPFSQPQKRRPGRVKDKTTRLAQGIRNQHMAMSVAAGLARAQLVPNPVGVYDARHLSDMLEVMAAAIARVAPIHAMNARTGEFRQLSTEELAAATFRHGATLLVLKDGTTISSVTITRGDLRHAVAVLKTIGFRGETQPETPAAGPTALAGLAQPVAEIEELLRLPLSALHVDKVNRLAMEIVRAARSGPVVNHAMQLISALHHARVSGQSGSDAVTAALHRLQQAVENARA